MAHLWRRTRRCALVVVLCALVLPSVARAQVTITPTGPLLVGGLYQYSYSVTNNSAFDLLEVSFETLPLANAILNPIAPAGFQIAFDPGPLPGKLGNVGLVSFLPSLGSPATFAPGMTLSGFSFQSPYGPNAAPFTATGLDFTTGGVATFSGFTVGPAAAIPEPGTLALGLTLAPGLIGLAMCRLRRRIS